MGVSWRTALLACGLLACSPREDPNFRRLQRTSLSYQGAPVGSSELLDLTWNVPCIFGLTSDGKRRCLPATLGDPGVRFVDDQCLTPVTTSAPGPGLDAFTVVTSGQDCDEKADLYRRGTTPRMASTFLRTNDDACLADPTPRLVFPLQRITDQAVEGTRVRGNAVGDIAPIYFVAAEQLLWTDGWHAQAQDVDCAFDLEDPVSFVAGGGGLVRCWPVDVTATARGVFADSQCHLPAVRKDGQACGAPGRFAVLVDQSHHCPTRRRTFRLGGTVPTAFTNDGGSCHLDVPTSRALLLSDEVFAEEWPRGQLVIPDEPVRISTALLQTAAATIGTDFLWDQQLGTFCQPFRGSDGHQRCLPDDVVVIDGATFADAACTQPVAPSPLPEDGCPLTFAMEVDATSGTATHLFRFGPRHTGALFVHDAGGACVPDQSAPDASQANFLLGAEIPIDSLAELQSNAP